MFILLQFATLPRRIRHQSFRSPFAATFCPPPTMASNPLLPSIIVVVADDVPAPPGDDGTGGDFRMTMTGRRSRQMPPPATTLLLLTSSSAARLRDIAQRPLSLSSPLLVVDIVVVVVPSLTSLFIAPSSLSALSDVVVGATLEGCIDGGISAGTSSPPSAVVVAIVVWGGSGRTSRRSQL
jgi:hypothetical protein